ENPGFTPSDRGVSYTFGCDALRAFLDRFGLDLVARAHQVTSTGISPNIFDYKFARSRVVEDGYEFFANRQLVTIFSAPNYCGTFDNAGAMMSVDANLMCSFQILRPQEEDTKLGRGAGGGLLRPILNRCIQQGSSERRQEAGGRLSPFVRNEWPEEGSSEGRQEAEEHIRTEAHSATFSEDVLKDFKFRWISSFGDIRRLRVLLEPPPRDRLLGANYCGKFDNAGGIVNVDEDLVCSFQILRVRLKHYPGD
ncbi:unnamed protein product, partial [Darwinula stevensoni]